MWSVATTPMQVETINNFIAEKCKKYPSFFGFGTMHIDYENIDEELQRVISQGLHGIKLHPDLQKFDIDDSKAIEVYKKIAKVGLPILFHTGDARYEYSRPQKLKNAMIKVPDMVAIAAHCGGYRRWQEARECLKDGNVYFDTSSTLHAISAESVVAMIEYFGEDRFFFGSDFPMWDHVEEIDKFMKLPLSESQREKIFYENFERLFKL